MSKLADEILALDDIQKERVYIKEWKRDIYVREMTGQERQEFLSLARDEKQHARAEAFLIALVACDETGEKIFSMDQVDALQKKNAKALDALGKVILALNKIGDDAVEAEKKDSEPTQSTDSTSSLRLA